jgi:beta-N-acetylhexosaminidase
MARGGVACLAVLALLMAGCTATAPEPTPAPAAKPAPPPIDPIVQYADDRLSVMSLDEKIQSMFMVHLPGIDPAGQAAFAAANHVGGLILMGDNIPAPADSLPSITAALSAERDLPLLIGIDQEGGIVARLPDSAASAAQLRYLDPAATRDAFSARGELLENAGVSVNFGIVADVTGDPASFIFERSLGSTAADAAARVSAAVEGESGHVLSTLKHFPGHGASPGDSHSSIPTTPMTLADWRAGHAPPFEAGIDAGAEVVMFGHLQFDAVDPQPATLSPAWHEILRDELGFDGIIITDDMAMLQNSGRPDLTDPATNAIRAIAAGNTMLLYVAPVDVAGIVTAVRNAVLAGALDEKLIDDAAHRILEARRTLSGETGRFVHCFDECQAMIE